MPRTAAALVLLVGLGACSAGDGGGVRVEARQAVLVTTEPLGDVVLDELGAGDTATARCFVPRARTNTGAAGSAVQVERGRLSGYAATTTLPADPGDRTAVFDLDERDLRARLPSCPA